MNEKPSVAPWFCGCGGSDPRQCLREILDAFTRESATGPYIDLKALAPVNERYTGSAVELILYFLDHLGYIEHSGAVSSSAWLTESGEELREWAREKP